MWHEQGAKAGLRRGSHFSHSLLLFFALFFSVLSFFLTLFFSSSERWRTGTTNCGSTVCTYFYLLAVLSLVSCLPFLSFCSSWPLPCLLNALQLSPTMWEGMGHRKAVAEVKQAQDYAPLSDHHAWNSFSSRWEALEEEKEKRKTEGEEGEHSSVHSLTCGTTSQIIYGVAVIPVAYAIL